MFIEKSLDRIFSEPPKPPCTYNLKLAENDNTTMFQLLMSVLIYGAKKLYGHNITPGEITSQQFDTLKSYIRSMGYVIKYNYSDLKLNNTNAPIINIWFEQYIPNVDCHGRILY